MEREKHPFDDYVPDGARYLILGSFPVKEFTQVSRKKLDPQDWYYGSSRNKFWELMARCYLGENQKLNSVDEKKRFLTKLHIGIADLCKEIIRKNPHSSLDKEIDKESILYNEEILRYRDIECIYFTSKAFVRTQFFRHFQDKEKEGIKINKINRPCNEEENYIILSDNREIKTIALPSPSTRYRMKLEKKLIIYKEKLPKES